MREEVHEKKTKAGLTSQKVVFTPSSLSRFHGNFADNKLPRSIRFVNTGA
jgi:hypothetical protein